MCDFFQSFGISILSKFFLYSCFFLRLQLALYCRHDLNVRSTSHLLLAFAALHEPCRAFLRRYFAKAIVLPTDWTAVPDLLQTFLLQGISDFNAGEREEGETLLWFLRDLIEPPKETCSSFTAKFYAQVPLLVFSYFPTFQTWKLFQNDSRDILDFVNRSLFQFLNNILLYKKSKLCPKTHL